MEVAAPEATIAAKAPGEVRLVHTADVHLDFPNERFRPGERSLRRKELRDRLGRVADLCVQLEADALLIAGDLFHQDYVSGDTVVACLETLGRLASRGVAVLVVPGNHDPLSSHLAGPASAAGDRAQGGVGAGARKGRSVWETYGFPEGVKVFVDADRWEPFTLRESGPRVTVWGLAYRRDRAGDRVLKRLAAALESEPPPAEDAYRVALVHGQVSGYVGFGDDYYPMDQQEVAAAPVDYLALGHVHSARVVAGGQGPGAARAVYPGALSRLEITDTDERVVAVVSLGPSEARSEPGPRARLTMVPVADRQFLDIAYDMGTGSLEDLVRTLQGLAAPNPGEAVVRARVTGVLPQGAELFQQAVTGSLSDRFFHLEVVDETLVLDGELSAGDTVRAGFVRELTSVLADPGASRRDKDVARLAVQYGLAALKGGLR